jgi:LysM repeat protein
MKQLWLAVIVLASAIFLWQAGRIWLGNRPVAESTPTNTADEVVPVATTPALDTTPQTHTVVAGETLNTIGIKYNLRWTSIAALNGLSETTPIREGQVLQLPITVSGHIIEVREVPVDATIAQNAQNDARFGGITWRLDSVEVARQTAPTELGIRHDTTLTIESRDDVAGVAIIRTEIDGQLRRVFLSQPITKGAEGVWFVIRSEMYRWPN